ncbi:MAG TPA: PadR family transcriptional regulator [Coleofasciculaceae cyanobacterium]
MLKPSLVSGKLSHSNPVGWDIQRAMQMKFEDIYQFFQDPPPNYLNKELAVCYVLSVLLQGESYGTQLIQQLEQEHPTYRLSDTVLYSALKFLEDAGAITGYWKKVEGRGRPRRMYQIRMEWRSQAQELAGFWRNYMTTGCQAM